MSQRDRSQDGLKTKVVFFVLTHFPRVWGFIQRVPVLERLANWILICIAISYVAPRPNALSTKADYGTWSTLTDKTWFGRHLPPQTPRPNAPAPEQVADLFRRRDAGRRSRKSSVLFAYFAQWFTDAFMRSDFRDHAKNRLKNTSSHHIDLCNLYGMNDDQTSILRSHRGGRLRSQTINDEEYPPYLCDRSGQRNPDFIDLPPLFAGSPVPMTPDQQEHLFAFGSDRANITTGYAMMNVLFLREHNRVAGVLAAANPHWDDERIFQTARNVLIVEVLRIVVEDYINHITPYHFKFRLPAGRTVNKAWHRDNWVSIEFNLLYRWHGLTPNVVFFGSTKVPLEASMTNNALLIEHGLADAFAGASTHPAGDIGMLNTPVSLYQRTDLPSINTGRLARLASYNDYRELCEFPRATSVDQISSDPAVRAGLLESYGHVDAIELYAGLFAEDQRPNSVLGPLMGRMVGFDALSQALTNPLLSDRLFKEETFSPAGWAMVNAPCTLNDVVARNVAAAPSVSFTLATFQRTSGWDRPATVPLET